MTPEDLQNITIVAEIDDELPEDAFRFKNEEMTKGTLQRLHHADLIRERDDAWSTTTWEWTRDGEYARRMSDTPPVRSASDGQLSALREHAERLQRLPVSEEFRASDHGLRGQALQTLSSVGLLDKADDTGSVIIWELSDFAVRTITSIEAKELDASEDFRARDVVRAD